MTNIATQFSFVTNSNHTIKAYCFNKNLPTSSNYYTHRSRNLVTDSINQEIINNRKLITDTIGYKVNDLCLLKQIHSNKVVFVENAHQLNQEPEADGLVTNSSDLILAVYTADCVPVLLADPVGNLIGAAHVGWRGATNRLINNIVQLMIDNGSEFSSIKAVIGPAIRQISYEVDQQFYQNIINQESINEQYFYPSIRHKHHQFDLVGYIKSQLTKLGINDIKDDNYNTYLESTKFFSHRRATIIKDQLIGQTIISAILITNR